MIPGALHSARECIAPSPLTPLTPRTPRTPLTPHLYHPMKPLTLLTLLASLILSACTPALLPPSPTPLEITDTTGHTAQLQNLPQRIVIAGKAIPMVQDAVYLFPESSEKIVALENRNQSAFAFLPVVDDAIPEIATLDFNAGPEQIAAYHPDLVLMKSYLAGQYAEPLQKLDIPSLYLDLETPQTFYRDIEVLGQIFGNPDRAQEIVGFYQTRVSSIEERLTSLDEAQKPRVLLLKYSDKGGEIAFNIPPATWIQTTLVEMAGGIPVWTDANLGQGWTVVTFEQIAAWNPDQIFIIDYAGNADQVVADLTAAPLWSDLAAVQAEQLYAFASDFYSWDQPDTRWILGLQWLATKIHPDLTQNLDIIAEVENFYSTLYRLDSSTIEAEVKPLLMGDIP